MQLNSTHSSTSGSHHAQSSANSKQPQNSKKEKTDIIDPPHKTVSEKNTGGNLMSGRYTFQAGSGDSVSKVADPSGKRSQVTKVNFEHGTYTTHSTSPRAELKLEGNLKEGGSYSYGFGFMREKHTSTTFFQILDNNGSKPSPRMWLSVKNDQYVLHLREDSSTGARVVTYNLGHATPGKWDDIHIDYKRAIGNGSVSISINGKNVFEKHNISTMYNTHAGAYAKIGQYRNQGDKSPGAVYFSGVSTNGAMGTDTGSSASQSSTGSTSSSSSHSTAGSNSSSSSGTVFDPSQIQGPTLPTSNLTYTDFLNSVFGNGTGPLAFLKQLIMTYNPGFFSLLAALFNISSGTNTGATGGPVNVTTSTINTSTSNSRTAA